MGNKMITNGFMDLQERSQKLIGQQMALVRDAQTADDRANAIVLLKASNKAQESILNGLAAVDTGREWNGLAARNAEMIERFLEGIGG